MILDRYILREHVGPFCFSLVALTTVLLLNQVLKLMRYIVDKGLEVSVVGELFLLSLPFIVVLTVPMAVLVATVLAFGRLTEDTELIAMKAAGVPLSRLMAPSIVAATLMGVGLAIFQDRVVPETNHRIRNLTSDIARKKPTFSLEPGVMADLDAQTRLRAESVDHRTGELAEVRLLELRANAPPVTFVAPQGRTSITEDGLLTLDLFDGEVLEPSSEGSDALRITRFGTYSFVFDVDTELNRTESGFRGDRELSIADMQKRISIDQRVLDDNWEKLSLARTQAQWPPTRDEWNRWQRWERVIDGKERQINRYRVELHKKLAISAACLSFVLIGAPLGAIQRRGGNLVGVATCLLLFISHYICLVGGERLADRGILDPAVAMWSPDIVVAVIGLALVYMNMHETISLRLPRRRVAPGGQA